MVDQYREVHQILKTHATNQNEISSIQSLIFTNVQFLIDFNKK